MLKLIPVILTFQDAPDSAKNRSNDLEKCRNRVGNWPFRIRRFLVAYVHIVPIIPYIGGRKLHES